VGIAHPKTITLGGLKMQITIEIPDDISVGRRSSFKKGIADALIESATKHPISTDFEITPEGHKTAREQGKVVGQELAEIIQESYHLKK
jgi:hypothetical protein